MIDVPFLSGAVIDPFEKRVPGTGVGGGPGRTPMSWDESLGGGFSAGTPWLSLQEMIIECEQQGTGRKV